MVVVGVVVAVVVNGVADIKSEAGVLTLSSFPKVNDVVLIGVEENVEAVLVKSSDTSFLLSVLIFPKVKPVEVPGFNKEELFILVDGV